MRLQDFYPIVVTEHLGACRDFYQHWFELDIVFEASWFVLLAAREGRASLAFMHPDHPSAPPGPSQSRYRCATSPSGSAGSDYSTRRESGSMSSSRLSRPRDGGTSTFNHGE